MLEIICPTNYQVERQYILSLLMTDFWGLEYRLSWSDEIENRTILQYGGRTLILHDGLFRFPQNEWLKEKTLPQEPLQRWPFCQSFSQLVSSEPCPLIYSAGVLPEPVHIGEDCIEFDLDILGSCFFMLARYEEIVKKENDGHERFSAVASLAYREGFLERPIVNEYMEILWAAMHRLFPSLKRKRRSFRLIPTHDIDHPFGMMYESYLQVFRHLAGDVLVRKSAAGFLQRLKDIWEIHFQRKQYIRKKKETYDFLFGISRKYGLKDMYFFMDSKRSQLDGNYYVSEPDVRELLQEIHAEGHLLGLHPSYVSYLDADEIAKEVAHVNQVFGDCKLPSLAGARQHYLRWRNPDTWRNYEMAKIPVDSSLGFADRVGFRCGVCYEYPVFDLCARRQLHLRELPLIIMDGTLTDYMRLSEADAMETVQILARECMRYSGDFVILWHNTTLDNESSRDFYQEMIERIMEKNGGGSAGERGQ